MSRKNEDYPEIEAIKKRLTDGDPDEVISVFIPSHDRKNKPVANQSIWASNAEKLFGKLYGGATSFNNLSGIYQPKKTDKPLFDTPIMVQSLTSTARIMDEDALVELSEFCHNMGITLNQASIGVVINNKFIDIIMNHDE